MYKLHLPDGPLPIFSFLQLQAKEKSQSQNAIRVASTNEAQKSNAFPGQNVVSNVLKKLQNSAAPRFSVEVVVRCTAAQNVCVLFARFFEEAQCGLILEADGVLCGKNRLYTNNFVY